jgi:hypothetical protein
MVLCPLKIHVFERIPYEARLEVGATIKWLAGVGLFSFTRWPSTM